MAGPEYEIGDLLRQKGLTLGVVESATGGLISYLITSVSGAEKVTANFDFIRSNVFPWL